MVSLNEYNIFYINKNDKLNGIIMKCTDIPLMNVFQVYLPVACLAHQVPDIFFHTRFRNPYHYILMMHNFRVDSVRFLCISDMARNSGFAVFASSSPGVQICFRYVCHISSFFRIEKILKSLSQHFRTNPLCFKSNRWLYYEICSRYL